MINTNESLDEYSLPLAGIDFEITFKNFKNRKDPSLLSRIIEKRIKDEDFQSTLKSDLVKILESIWLKTFTTLPRMYFYLDPPLYADEFEEDGGNPNPFTSKSDGVRFIGLEFNIRVEEAYYNALFELIETNSFGRQSEKTIKRRFEEALDNKICISTETIVEVTGYGGG